MGDCLKGAVDMPRRLRELFSRECLQTDLSPKAIAVVWMWATGDYQAIQQDFEESTRIGACSCYPRKDPCLQTRFSTQAGSLMLYVLNESAQKRSPTFVPLLHLNSPFQF
uniref:Uncharacterized protein n=1 Tax=Ditylenchus dipsaci TaxID=166011 RepID=A0A915EFK2_9BILA